MVAAATAQREERARSTARLSGVTKRIDAIDAVIPMVAVGIPQLHQRRESLEKTVSAIEATLPEAETAVATLPSDAAFRRQSLSKALRDRTEPDHVVESITGHLSRRMLEHYSHIRLKAKKAALDRLDGSTKGTSIKRAK